MKKIIGISLITLLMFGTIYSQDCSIYYPVVNGSIREMTSYDKKDKVTSKVIQEITNVNKSISGVEIDVKNSLFDEDGNLISEVNITVGCKDGVFKVDMGDYVSELIRAYQTMEVELKGDDLSFPSKMKQGDLLPDGNMNIKVTNSGMTLMNMDVTIYNRKVEGIEKITTPAGTFSCYKISYDTTAKTKILNVQSSAVEWISENVGLVKSESFNKKGKLNSYSLLTDLK